MRSFFTRNWIPASLILIISIFFVFDLFVHKGAPVTFDGPTHIANIAQVFEGLKDRDFPVRWGGGWARYGWPAPEFAQQTPAYLGAIITFVTHDVVLSYNLVIFLTLLMSTMLFYTFLKMYVSCTSAFLGALLYHFAPYRIMNVYIRGALPELMAGIFIISILISLYLSLKKQVWYGYLLLSLSVCFLLLTHPFMFIVGCFLFVPYGLLLIYKNPQSWKMNMIFIVGSIFIGVGLASYYLVPLFMEVKYLYYGSSDSHYTAGQFLSLRQYISDTWRYFSESDIGPRGHYHNGGIIEGLILCFAIVHGFKTYIKKHIIISPFNVFLCVGIVYIIFTLPITELLYQKWTLLGNIQHPWRMLTGYIIIPPILFAFLFEATHHKKVVLVIFIFAIAFFRFPQLYGKNYTDTPQKSFFETYDNLHGTHMNTVWMGEVRDYPFKKEKIEIIEGRGSISEQQILNSSRRFKINALTQVTLVDHTFYFPGWKTFIDGVEIPIQFQDPAQRGVITYQVPAGESEISTIFTRTKPRILGEIISIVSLTIIGLVIILRQRIKLFISHDTK